MGVLTNLFRKKSVKQAKTVPFYTLVTYEERLNFLQTTPPWNRVSQTVIKAILEGITDKLILEFFVLTSTRVGLVTKYERLGRKNIDSNPTIIRTQISQILCNRGGEALAELISALEAGRRDTAKEAYRLVRDTFESAIALAKNCPSSAPLAQIRHFS